MYTYAVDTQAKQSMNNHRCSSLRHQKFDEPAMLNRTHLGRVALRQLELVAGGAVAAAVAAADM